MFYYQLSLICKFLLHNSFLRDRMKTQQGRRLKHSLIFEVFIWDTTRKPLTVLNMMALFRKQFCRINVFFTWIQFEFKLPGCRNDKNKQLGKLSIHIHHKRSFCGNMWNVHKPHKWAQGGYWWSVPYFRSWFCGIKTWQYPSVGVCISWLSRWESASYS